MVTRYIVVMMISRWASFARQTLLDLTLGPFPWVGWNDCSHGPHGGRAHLLMKPGLDPFQMIPRSSFSPDPHPHGCCLCRSIWDLGTLLKWTWFYTQIMHFPGGSDGKESACNAGDLGLIPGLGRSPGEGNCYTLQYSGLDNSMDRGAWKAIAQGVTQS